MSCPLSHECYYWPHARFNPETKIATIAGSAVKLDETTDTQGFHCYVPTNSWCPKTWRFYETEHYTSGTFEQRIMNGIRDNCQVIIDDMPGDVRFMKENILQIVGDDSTDDELFVTCVERMNFYFTNPQFAKEYPKCIESMKNFANELQLNYNFDKRQSRFFSWKFRSQFYYHYKVSLPYVQPLYYNNQKVDVQYYNARDLKGALAFFKNHMRALHEQKRWMKMHNVFKIPECVIFGLKNSTIYPLNEHEISAAVTHINDKNAFVMFPSSQHSADRNLLISKILCKYGKYNHLYEFRAGGTFICRVGNEILCWKSSEYTAKQHIIDSPTKIIEKKSYHLGKFCNYCLVRKYSEYNEKYTHCILVRCSGCRSVAYCSRKCQKKDWSRHKKDCLTQITASFKKIVN